MRISDWSSDLCLSDLGFVRIFEVVHGRERAFDAVGHGHAEHAAVDAELEETPVRPRADQELLELAGAVVVHAAAAMARLEVALVQGELLVGALRVHHAHGDVGIAAQAAALAAVGDEVGHRHAHCHAGAAVAAVRSEEHTSELQSLMRISYAVFCLKKKNTNTSITLI